MCSNTQAVALSGVDGPRYHSIYSESAGFNLKLKPPPYRPDDVE